MNRRDFLARSTGAAAGAGLTSLLPSLFASSSLAQSAKSYKAIVCLLLDGGCDGNNMLIPTDAHYSEYSLARQPLAIPVNHINRLSPGNSARSFGTHPALKQIASLYNTGEAAWVANTGPLTMPLTKQKLNQGALTPSDLFNHSTEKTQWQSAVTTKSDSSVGWAGRMSDLMSSSNSASTIPMIISTAGWQLLGTGAKTSAAAVATGANSIATMNAVQGMMPTLIGMEGNDPHNHLHDMVSAMQSSTLQTAKSLQSATSAGAGLKTVFPLSSIGQQLQLIAQMIGGHRAVDATRQVFVCQDVGYDTHTDQLLTQNIGLANIDAAIGSFASAMQELGLFDQVTLFTITDFARSLQFNSTGGTDHGWGNHLFMVGGAVKGGQIFGTFPSLNLGGDDDLGSTGLWIPTTSGSQYAATFASWLGTSASDNALIFPELRNFATASLPFFG